MFKVGGCHKSGEGVEPVSGGGSGNPVLVFTVLVVTEQPRMKLIEVSCMT